MKLNFIKTTLSTTILVVCFLCCKKENKLIKENIETTSIEIKKNKQEEKKVEESNIQTCLSFENLKLPYNKKTKISSTEFQTTSCIDGISRWSCGDEELRYLPILNIEKNQLIIIPMDCGDSSYRLYLLSISENQIVSDLYVEGELYEPENVDNVEISSFKIDNDYSITVETIKKKDNKEDPIIKKYIISPKGEFIEFK